MLDPAQLAQQTRPTTTSVVRGPIKSAERPTIGPRPPLGTMLFVKYLDFSLVQSFEFSLDNSLIQDTLDIVGAG